MIMKRKNKILMWTLSLLAVGCGCGGSCTGTTGPHDPTGTGDGTLNHLCRGFDLLHPQCDTGLTCHENVCVHCGLEGDYCCNGTTCSAASPLSCEWDDWSMGNVCSSCGNAGQRCCNTTSGVGNWCNAGATCDIPSNTCLGPSGGLCSGSASYA